MARLAASHPMGGRAIDRRDSPTMSGRGRRNVQWPQHPAVESGHRYARTQRESAGMDHDSAIPTLLVLRTANVRATSVVGGPDEP
jgi:hypothetical protein